MRRWLACSALLLGGAPLGWALEAQPWFGDVYEFHLLSAYTYSWFNSVAGGVPQLTSTFQSNLIYFGLDFSLTPEWSLDADIQFADTTARSFNFRTTALQGRYLWLDDIVGDPISFDTGASIRFTPSGSLKDISCPSHANVDFELNFSLGKEIDKSDTWRFRLWGFGAVGHANRGSPWVRAIVGLESNIEDLHRLALFAEGINGYGGHTTLDPFNFYGYAKVREKAIDLTFRYGYKTGVWGTLRLEYTRRLLAKAAPAAVNGFTLSYLLPFSL